MGGIESHRGNLSSVSRSMVWSGLRGSPQMDGATPAGVLESWWEFSALWLEGEMMEMISDGKGVLGVKAKCLQ